MRTHQFKKNAMLIGLLTTLSFTAVAPASAGPTLYDAFNEPTLSPVRWQSGYSNEGAVELITEVRKNDLHMRIRGIADIAATTGQRATIANRLFMTETNAASVRMFQTYSRVNSADVRECTDAGAAKTQSRFLHVAQWFNNGTSSSTEDYTGNVYTILGFRKSLDTEKFGERVDILGNVGICADADCNTSQNLWFSRLGSVAVKQNVLLRTAWDKDAKQFRFLMKPQGEDAITGDFSYDGLATDDLLPVTKRLVFPRHQLRAQVQVAECDIATSGSRRPFAMIDTKVYNVRVDSTADGY